MKLVVLCPHFDPDTAPTGRVISRIVAELAERGHDVHVVTSLPWYQHHRVSDGWQAILGRRERTAWGTILRLNPFAGDDKRNLLRRAVGFAGFSVAATLGGFAAGGWGRVDAVIAMSPPLTMGLAGRLVAWTKRAPLIFNIQDVFPDAAIATGAITDRRIIAVASSLERWSYRLSDAVTVERDVVEVGRVLPRRARIGEVLPDDDFQFGVLTVALGLALLVGERDVIAADDRLGVVVHQRALGERQLVVADVEAVVAEEHTEIGALAVGAGGVRVPVDDTVVVAVHTAGDVLLAADQVALVVEDLEIAGEHVLGLVGAELEAVGGVPVVAELWRRGVERRL